MAFKFRWLFLLFMEFINFPGLPTKHLSKHRSQFPTLWGYLSIAILLGVVILPGLIKEEGPLYSPSIAKHSTWIIQWKQSKDPTFDSVSRLVNDYPEVNISVATPNQRMNEKEWLEYWQDSEYVAYVQPNHKYVIAQTVSDSLLSVPAHLKQIGVEEAWQHTNPASDLTIAVVDTGIDLNHPDLKDNLVPGINLISPGLPPLDDHGHGTGVAGVLAAANNKEAGVSGVLWEASIMPIKALESNGHGDEDKLGEGIRYAVDNGASIVVLSLGLNKPSPYMESIVRYAEEKGVLLVAATGNEGNVVKFPAAYPTVLAVAGGTSQGADPRSNSGPEVDVMAPWTVYTTRLGGSYGYQEGTSLAAPLVAAVSALLWNQHPEWEPYQIRNAIRQSAENPSGVDWDSRIGFGMLKADRAVSQEYRDHLYEGHHSMAQAKPLTVSQQIADVLGNGESAENWYKVDSPYEGTLKVRLESEAKGSWLIRHHGLDFQSKEFTAADSETVMVPVNQGTNYIQVVADSVSESTAYRITTGFEIAPDEFEDNDRQYTAYRLPQRSIEVIGNFHQEEDHDWFSMKIDEPGKLRVVVDVDTARMDPVILVQRQGMREIRVDEFGDGQSEDTGWIEVTPGTYYFRISNILGYSAPVMGNYTLKVDFEPAAQDSYDGAEKQFADIAGHWAEQEILQLAGEGVLEGVDHRQFAPDRRMSRAEAVTALVRWIDGTSSYEDHRDQAFTDVGMEHWAYPYILYAHEHSLIQGYEDGGFHPEALVTRMEMLAMLSRAIPVTIDTPAANDAFTDVTPDFWGYPLLTGLFQASVIEGYEDGSFRPNQPATRAEFVSFLAKWLK